MRKTMRHKELPVVISSKFTTDMPAEPGGPATNVNGNVQHPSGDHSHQLGLGMFSPLEMEPADHPVSALALVVLHKADRAHSLVKNPLVPALEEIAPVIPENTRFQDKDSGYGSFNDVHRHKDTNNIYGIFPFFCIIL